ncbi:MAG: segregation/condensation protein A [Eggerthellaceae bacterium]|nr:segregation/condensation protein A [Eggerthellaceae bacterium]
MAYRVRIDSFEGPFDLLLYLVSRQKVDIGSISINEIADQFLREVSRMQNLDLDVASDFLLVAATLLEVKAASLIPQARSSIDEELEELSPLEARELLLARLMDYKKFKNAAAMMHARLDSQARMHPRPFGPDRAYILAMPDFLEGISLEALAAISAYAYARREKFLLESEHIAARAIPVEVHIRAIHARIAREKSLKFSDLISAAMPKELLVVCFLAVLELYKRNMVKLVQKQPLGDIRISFVEGSGPLSFEGADAITSVATEGGIGKAREGAGGKVR